MTQSDDELRKENERLKSEILYQKVKRDNDLAKAEYKAEIQKNKQTEIMAFLAVGLFCAVAIILALTGVID